MSKIKGWKKVGKNRWVNKLGYRTIIRKDSLGRYTIFLEDDETNEVISLLGIFKTKTQAKNYATRWMKAHPRG